MLKKGIGYFTLVYLVHAKASKVIACEWNPESVRALKNNLLLNKIDQDRCEVREGDNRLVCPTNCADRVNLGLIPSSEPSWPTACRALRVNSGGMLHIHGNVDIGANGKEQQRQAWNKWANYARAEIERLLIERDLNELNHAASRWKVSIEHIEYVKSYGPRVDHLVLDLKCHPLVHIQ